MSDLAAAGTRLAGRYARIREQLAELFVTNRDPLARMATVVALLHHKNPHFFWTGFYRLVDGDLIVGPYQGPLACALLEREVGVCWAGVLRRESVLVPDVHQFEGHIACDARSASEVVVPLRDAAGQVIGVLDVDSAELDAFSEVDVAGLESIVELIYADL
jgi:GAF domain-containing protein